MKIYLKKKKKSFSSSFSPCVISPSILLKPPGRQQCDGDTCHLIWAKLWTGRFPFHKKPKLFQEGAPLPGPESGLLSNTQKWSVQGDTLADKARDFIGKGRPGGEHQGKGKQENCSARWLAVLGFMVMGLVSGLSLSWWCTHHSAKMDSSKTYSRRLVGHMDWHLLSPFFFFPLSFWPFPNFPVGSSLLVPRSLPGPPDVR